MAQTYEWAVTAQQAGVRLDALLAQELDISRSQAQQWLEKGLVSAAGKALNKKDKLKEGALVTVEVPDPVSYDVQAENIPLDIVYEDAHLLVVNKPKGMVVHPAAGHYSGTLVNALMHHCGDSLSGINGVLRPGIVHRIDRDTSGLLMVAKSDAAHQGLAEQIKAHSFTRVYEAMVVGHPKDDAGTVSAPIGRHPHNRKKMAVITTNAKEATTHYEVLCRYPGYSHLRLKLETGRTHQIRVHMAHIGHPVAGDTVYGAEKQPKICQALNGQCLHAKCVGFVHPITGEELYFESELPGYFTDFIEKLQ
ncbi:MAG: RluA family pseudouridine synthase [Ruminococcaceae bacterium]|nr:RluA family pseudouridine synthase [Oscillospiraceae bacterium]